MLFLAFLRYVVYSVKNPSLLSNVSCFLFSICKKILFFIFLFTRVMIHLGG